MRLADQIIAAAGAELDNSYSGAIASLGADIARAQCFELSDDVREACCQVAQSKPSSILSAMPLMRLPYAKTWVEWSTPPETVFCDFSSSPDTFMECPRQFRVGCLFDAPDGLDNGRMYAALDWLPGAPNSERQPHAMPFAVYFEWAADRDMRPMKAAISWQRAELCSADDIAHTIWPRHSRNPAELAAAEKLLHRALTVPDMTHHFAGWWRDHEGDQDPSHEAQIGMVGFVDCVWPTAMAFIVMLNAKGAIERVDENPSKLNRARKKRASLR
jgi:hypothetical protein